MLTLREALADAEKRGVALGHFNISNIEGLHGVWNAARALKLPVVIGVSEGERDFIGVRQCVALIKSLREGENYPIFLNADHSYSVERVKEAIDAGFDAVIFDGAELPLAENISKTRDCVSHARACGREVLVEGELGYIGKSSKLLDTLPEGAAQNAESFTSPEEAARFVKETGVDLLAPAVGNIHGMLKHSKDPHLDISRIKAIREAAGVPLVLHGGSGTPDEDFVAAIKAGMPLVHISTELRVAFRDALKLALQEDPEEVVPYKIMRGAVAAIEAVTTSRLKLFNGIA